MVNRVALGRATWWFLHWAANQPDAERHLPLLVAYVREHYPCELCRANFKRLVLPPLTDGPLPLWVSLVHNRVRQSLGQPVVLGPLDPAPDVDALRRWSPRFETALRTLYARKPPLDADDEVLLWIDRLDKARCLV